MTLKKTVFSFKIMAGLLVLARLISLPFMPMFDITEARYAEIGRRMYETGNYVTPYQGDNFPFWGKPPLSFWASAVSFEIFGVSDFAAHFPHFLFLLAVAVFTYLFAKKYFDEVTGWVSAVILLSCFVFLYLMGGVMTDPALAFAVILSIFSFWNALYSEKKPLLWGYAFFVGLGLALLAKGPIGLIMTGFPIGLWVIIKNRWRDAWSKIPWITGIVLMLAIAAPWYVLAEMRTPGFLRYFFVGEHYERFLIPHWPGDLYGGGRGGFKGIIWVFYFVSLLPWSLYFTFRFFKKNDFDSKTAFLKDDLLLYMFLGVVCPLAFFSLSSNTILPYTVTSMPLTAILLGRFVCVTEGEPRLFKFKLITGLNVFVLASATVLWAAFPDVGMKIAKTDKYMVEKYFEAAKSRDEPLLVFSEKKDVLFPAGKKSDEPVLVFSYKTFSADFYSDGRAKKAHTLDDVRDYLDRYGTVFVIIHKGYLGMEKDITMEPVYVNRDRMLIKMTKNK